MAGRSYRPCKTCGEEKPTDEFYRDKNRRDGLRAECKACVKLRRREWGRANPERAQAIRSRWEKRHPRQAAEAHRRYPEKYKARTDLNNALKLGKIVKPNHCEQCQQATKSRKLHGHHEDYSRPLDVVWLCQACHTKRHS